MACFPISFDKSSFNVLRHIFSSFQEKVFRAVWAVLVYSWLDGSILYDQDNDNDSITMDEDPNCTEISCSEINPKLEFNPGHEDADGDVDGDESHKEPESD